MTKDNQILQKVADTVRGLSADGTQKANSGHPGLPLGCAEIGTVLFSEIMKHNPAEPSWADRDRFVLSAGHGSMLLYSLLHLSGYKFTLDDLKNFRQLGSHAAGHPECCIDLGIETTTGPLGQGVGNGVGMALSEAMMAERFNTNEVNLVDHYTYVLCGDGCQMEGISGEASSFAGHLGLGKLILIYDSNKISIEGSTDLAFSESVADRYKAYNWHVQEIDGNNIDEVRRSINIAKDVKDKPSIIVAKTIIAKGAPTLQGSEKSHGAPLGEEEIKRLKDGIGLPSDKTFYVPDEVYSFFKEKRKEWANQYKEWKDMFNKWKEENGQLYDIWKSSYENSISREAFGDIQLNKAMSTREAGGEVLNAIAKKAPFIAGGSADLSPSTKTNLENETSIKRNDFSGRNIHFGVREHAMGSILNGMSLHGGFRVYGSTFLVFSDYMRHAVRLSSLMNQPVVYVFTHDSIYVGEDGPTHQPIEHLDSLRSIPGMVVLRPADAKETKAAWYYALKRTDGPTCLALTRQKLPLIDGPQDPMDLIQYGAYTVLNPEIKAQAVLVASGSEVSLCMEAAEKLNEENIAVKVVSVPSRELFLQQSEGYINNVIEKDLPALAVEAGRGSGWYEVIKGNGKVLSLDRFGESGPGPEVAKHMGLTTDSIIKHVKSMI